MSAEAMKTMAKEVRKYLPKDFGFTIIVFPFKAPGISNYISNANRLDMIKALRETANRLEKKEDFKTPDNNLY